MLRTYRLPNLALKPPLCWIPMDTKAATVLELQDEEPQITVSMSEEWEVHWIIAGISGAWTWAWVEYRLWAWVSVVVTTRAMFETVCIVRKTLRQTRICAIIRCNAGHVDINYLRHVRSSVRFRNKSLGSAMFPQIIWARQWYSLKLLLHSSNSLTVPRMEMKLGMHVYYIVSKTTDSLRHFSLKLLLHSSL